MTETKWPAVPWWRLYGLSQSATAFALGIVLATIVKFSNRGFNGAAKYIGIFVLLLVALLLAKAVRNGAQTGWDQLRRRTWQRLALGLAWSPIWLVVLFVSFLGLGFGIVPDPAPLYFRLRKSYIQEHWQRDAVSGRLYFGIDYIKVFNGPNAGKLFPRTFFIMDDGSFPTSTPPDIRAIANACQQAKYEFTKIDDRVSFVQAYVDDVDEELLPCLIQPTSEPRN
jgi:hypothetical protein